MKNLKNLMQNVVFAPPKTGYIPKPKARSKSESDYTQPNHENPAPIHAPESEYKESNNQPKSAHES